MARSSSPDIPGEHVKVAYRVVGYATVSGPPETCRSPQLSATSGFAWRLFSSRLTELRRQPQPREPATNCRRFTTIRNGARLMAANWLLRGRGAVALTKNESSGVTI
jgi:hypothetical protein